MAHRAKSPLHSGRPPATDSTRVHVALNAFDAAVAQHNARSAPLAGLEKHGFHLPAAAERGGAPQGLAGARWPPGALRSSASVDVQPPQTAAGRQRSKSPLPAVAAQRLQAAHGAAVQRGSPAAGQRGGGAAGSREGTGGGSGGKAQPAHFVRRSSTVDVGPPAAHAPAPARAHAHSPPSVAQEHGAARGAARGHGGWEEERPRTPVLRSPHDIFQVQQREEPRGVAPAQATLQLSPRQPSGAAGGGRRSRPLLEAAGTAGGSLKERPRTPVLQDPRADVSLRDRRQQAGEHPLAHAPTVPEQVLAGLSQDHIRRVFEEDEEDYGGRGGERGAEGEGWGFREEAESSSRTPPPQQPQRVAPRRPMRPASDVERSHAPLYGVVAGRLGGGREAALTDYAPSESDGSPGAAGAVFGRQLSPLDGAGGFPRPPSRQARWASLSPDAAAAAGQLGSSQAVPRAASVQPTQQLVQQPQPQQRGAVPQSRSARPGSSSRRQIRRADSEVFEARPEKGRAALGPRQRHLLPEEEAAGAGVYRTASGPSQELLQALEEAEAEAERLGQQHAGMRVSHSGGLEFVTRGALGSSCGRSRLGSVGGRAAAEGSRIRGNQHFEAGAGEEEELYCGDDRWDAEADSEGGAQLYGRTQAAVGRQGLGMLSPPSHSGSPQVGGTGAHAEAWRGSAYEDDFGMLEETSPDYAVIHGASPRPLSPFQPQHSGQRSPSGAVVVGGHRARTPPSWQEGGGGHAEPGGTFSFAPKSPSASIPVSGFAREALKPRRAESSTAAQLLSHLSPPHGDGVSPPPRVRMPDKLGRRGSSAAAGAEEDDAASVSSRSSAGSARPGQAGRRVRKAMSSSTGALAAMGSQAGGRPGREQQRAAEQRVGTEEPLQRAERAERQPQAAGASLSPNQARPGTAQGKAGRSAVRGLPSSSSAMAGEPAALRRDASVDSSAAAAAGRGGGTGVTGEGSSRSSSSGGGSRVAGPQHVRSKSKDSARAAEAEGGAAHRRSKSKDVAAEGGAQEWGRQAELRAAQSQEAQAGGSGELRPRRVGMRSQSSDAGEAAAGGAGRAGSLKSGERPAAKERAAGGKRSPTPLKAARKSEPEEEPAEAEEDEGAVEEMQAMLYKSKGRRFLGSAFEGLKRLVGVASTDRLLGREYSDIQQSFGVLLDRELGAGQFGVTRLAVSKQTGQRFACKTITKASLKTKSDIEDVRREVAVLELLRGHPRVARLEAVFEDVEHVHIVMELCPGGELFDKLKELGRYEEGAAAAVMHTLLDVLAFCHEHCVVHRDVKPENILLMAPQRIADVKVIDFGIAAILKPGGPPLTEYVGSAFYVAPEVLDGCYGAEADVWSAGVVMFILLSGVPPFWGKSEAAMNKAIREAKLSFKNKAWKHVSEDAKDLIRRLLTRDVKKRITAKQAKEHKWFSKAQSKR